MAGWNFLCRIRKWANENSGYAGLLGVLLTIAVTLLISLWPARAPDPPVLPPAPTVSITIDQSNPPNTASGGAAVEHHPAKKPVASPPARPSNTTIDQSGNSGGINISSGNNNVINVTQGKSENKQDKPSPQKDE